MIRALIIANVVLVLIAVQVARFGYRHPFSREADALFLICAGLFVAINAGWFLWRFDYLGAAARIVRVKRQATARAAAIRQRILDRADEP